MARRSWSKVVVLALTAMMLLSWPLAAGAAGSNGIATPKDGATVSGKVDVTGSASDPNFQKWQLDFLPGGDPNAAIFLAVGLGPGDFSYSLDTTTLPNGQHALRLRDVRTDGNYSEYTNKLTIANGGAAAPAPAPAPAKAITSTATSTTVKVATDAKLGSYLVDAPGKTLYLYTKDDKNVSNCYDQCAVAWPPLYTTGAPTGGQGVDGSLLGTTTRKDGQTQVSYNGSPLYYWVKDQKPGDTTGQGVGGVWFVISPSGEKITTTVPAATPAVTATVPAVTPAVTAAAPAAKPAAAAAANANGITSPAAGATVSGTVEFKGLANDPNFMKWQLDLLPGGNPDAAAFLGVGFNPGQFSYAVDTTNLPNGDHAVRLRVVRTDSNYTEYTTKFTIANH